MCLRGSFVPLEGLQECCFAICLLDWQVSQHHIAPNVDFLHPVKSLSPVPSATFHFYKIAHLSVRFHSGQVASLLQGKGRVQTNISPACKNMPMQRAQAIKGKNVNWDQLLPQDNVINQIRAGAHSWYCRTQTQNMGEERCCSSLVLVVLTKTAVDAATTLPDGSDPGTLGWAECGYIWWINGCNELNVQCDIVLSISPTEKASANRIVFEATSTLTRILDEDTA